MVYRIYTEHNENLEAKNLFNELKNIHGFKNLRDIRILNRYDVEGLTPEILEQCKFQIFADPYTDMIINIIPDGANYVLGVEYLPGQYDQRADAAEQCASLLAGVRPVIKTARIYLFYGECENFEAVKKFLINPVEAREADLKERSSLIENYTVPEDVPVIKDFTAMSLNELENLITQYSLAMSVEDLQCCQKYFKSENREPTLTELKVLDTYWSDHCRHTTFLTSIDDVEIDDEKIKTAFKNYMTMRAKLNYSPSKPVNLMDIATIGAKIIKPENLVKSEENNACTVEIEIDGEKWLLLFKNETHNHPTEIEPFGGAATCIGGAIRDPLSGRAYVYQAMRITGAANPFKDTLPGKLTQREIITKAAAGYSSYGNQIGIPTGLVEEIYHEGYKAKRLETGAVIACALSKNVIRKNPAEGDCVLLLGGKTGRDGCGGATGSSIAHNENSIGECGAEVQKGNAPEERKLQRLFKNPEFTRLIKRCNDFGAGGVSVAVGELADGLEIDLDAVPLKYAGLDGTETAVSESQERMAVVVDKNDIEKIKALAESEDVQASLIARVTNSGRMKMQWRGKEILNLTREFINTNGAERHIKIKSRVKKSPENRKNNTWPEILSDLNSCSHRGLAERFDSTVGAKSVLMPFGGKFQKTPSQAMAGKIGDYNSKTCSLMTFGYNPFKFERSCFDGAYLAVAEALSKIIASGGNLKQCWLTFQEYFGKPENNPERWSDPFTALLGALTAQIDFQTAAIGGKDSMSGTFKNHDGEILDVPPTLIAFAVSVADIRNIISPEFKKSGSRVILLTPEIKNDLPEKESMLKIFSTVENLIADKKILSAAVPTFGGVGAMIFKMCLGNNYGFEFVDGMTREKIFDDVDGAFILELADYDLNLDLPFVELGHVLEEPVIKCEGECLNLNDLEQIYNAPFEKIFPIKANSGDLIKIPASENILQRKLKAPHSLNAKPKFLIPVFAGTNCEYETAYAVEKAGGESEIFVVRTLTPDAMKFSAKEFAERLDNSQALILPGGFSNGDEPDGSGKFIAIFLRSPIVREAVENLLARENLICGICNGFQALVKTGLLPYGKFCAPVSALTFNDIGRHQSKIVRVKALTNNSAWLSKVNQGEIYSVPISHGEGKFLCDEALLNDLALKNQIAAQYVDIDGNATMNTEFNPNGSIGAVEGLISPDGKILGRMGHVERVGENLYKNVAYDNYFMKVFESACEYFK